MSKDTRPKSRLGRLWLVATKLKLAVIVAIVLAAIISLAYIIRSCENNSISVSVDDSIGLTPAQITSMREIGEWEFLSIENEELVDTTRKGFFKDDTLIRVYFGTLRLGFDMADAPEDWIRCDNDTLSVRLPAIRLLDEDFIDEARTRSFFESGKWSDTDRANLYKVAYQRMKTRCLTKDNLKTAETNAERQFRSMLKAFGVNNVKISFATESRQSQ